MRERNGFTLIELSIAAILLMNSIVYPAIGQVRLVDRGQPVATIVLPNKPTPSEKVAADDLQLYLSRMSGAELPIVWEKDRPAGFSLDIGATFRGLPLRAGLAKRPDLNDESLVIDVSDEKAVLIGLTDAGTSHAVYLLLERLSVRWLMPTAKGTYVPQTKTVSLANQVTFHQPAFIVRREVSGIWARRNRLGA